MMSKVTAAVAAAAATVIRLTRAVTIAQRKRLSTSKVFNLNSEKIFYKNKETT